ncbi:MAG: hypothetical protein HFE62_05605 [Firmicutes bacterium]|nr:hypothetical protein [Bacillota bacterium]
MSDILKVTTPNTVFENAQRPNPVNINDPVIQNIADPTKVTRPDGQAATNEQNLGLNYESNFENFVLQLKNTPNVVEVFSQIFFQMGTEVSSGIGKNFAAEISKFMEMMNMTPETLLSFVKEQAAGSEKFSGEFFSAMKEVLVKTSSPELQREILNFVKTYNDTSSSETTLKNITSILKNMTRYMTSNHHEKLTELSSKLQPRPNLLGENPENTQILKKEIVPFLSNYVKQTNDFGKVRDLITMLTLNVAKYENGSYDKLIQSFTKLMSFKDFNSVFSDVGDDVLIRLLNENGGDNTFSDTFVSIIKKGLSGEAGFETKTVLQNVMNSMLVNQSVYMPLQHFIIPADVFGHVMFSEIWVDPDNNDEGSGGYEQSEHGSKLLIKFDIKDLGFFDLIISQRKDKVDIQIFYPDSMTAMEKTIKKDIAEIAEKNGFSAASIFAGKSVRPKTLTEVFRKLNERKNGVNVKI